MFVNQVVLIPIEPVSLHVEVFVDPTEEEEAIMSQYPYDKISLGPVSLHANHCMVVVHNEMDRRRAA